jgi:predicted metalloprotease with PDZ domain
MSPLPSAIAVPRDAPFCGVLGLHVEATNSYQNIYRIQETLPLQTEGDFVLLYPEWDTGSHAPTASAVELDGLEMKIDGKPAEWRRDVMDVHAFHVEVPAHAQALSLIFDYLSPPSDAVLRPEMVVLPWQRLLLYAAGWYARDIMVSPAVTLAAGLVPFSSLAVLPKGAAPSGEFAVQPVTLDRLIDSPVYAAKYASQLELTTPPAVPVHLDLLADAPADLAISPAELGQLRSLVAQTEKVFGPPPAHHYDVLVSLSDTLSPECGNEHLDEGENNLPANYLSAPALQLNNLDLIAHEFVHAWNGRFRQPAGLWSPNVNRPTDPSLLWVYEGQTEFWGRVLAARANMRSVQQTLDKLALDGFTVDNRPGRAWKTLADSSWDVLYMPGHTVAWRDWQRREDYYPEGVLLWLDVNARLRELSNGKYGLDNFAHEFFATHGSVNTVSTYTLEDLYAALNRLAPSDWKEFLYQHLSTHSTEQAMAGFARSGWRLTYTPVASETFLQEEADFASTNLDTSIGLTVRATGAIRSVVWDGPAFRVGLAPGTRVTSVNGRPFSRAVLLQATADSMTAPVRLSVQTGDVQRDITIPYRGPLRYPHLERIAGTRDWLTPLLTER